MTWSNNEYIYYQSVWNSNTDNSHIIFAHRYCFPHKYIVSLIIPYFMNKFSPYIQWMPFFIFSNVVAAFWSETSKNMSAIHLRLYLISYIIMIFIVILTGIDFYWERTVEAKCLWLNFHVKFCLKCFSIITLCHHRIIACRKSFSSNVFVLMFS